MTSIDRASLDLASHPLVAVDAIELANHPTHTATVQAVIPIAAPVRLDEPTSLALALIGAATLAAYRGLQSRIAPAPAIKAVQPALVKPRRRVA